jgi:hypothetical protein
MRNINNSWSPTIPEDKHQAPYSLYCFYILDIDLFNFKEAVYILRGCCLNNNSLRN